MYRFFLLLCLHFCCASQVDRLQPIGSVATHVMFCPCKLFKYYDNNEVFYFCDDKSQNIEYIIREFKHKQGFELILDGIEKNLLQKHDSIVQYDKTKYLNNYLNSVKDGVVVDLLGEKAVLIDGEKKQSCNILAKEYENCEIITIEGLKTFKAENV